MRQGLDLVPREQTPPGLNCCRTLVGFKQTTEPRSEPRVNDRDKVFSNNGCDESDKEGEPEFRIKSHPDPDSDSDPEP